MSADSPHDQSQGYPQHIIMKLRIFREAKALVNQGKVEFIGSGRDAMFFNVTDNVTIELRMETNRTICTCKGCSIHADKPGLLCSYKLAAFYYLLTKKCVPPEEKVFK